MLAHGLIQRVGKFIILAGVLGVAALISVDAKAQETLPYRLIAQASRTFRVEFEANRSSAVLNNSVIRGTRDTYLLDSQAGQTMTVTISSVENNAVFEIISPNSETPLVQDSTSWSGTLPASGDYQIIVGGTRGNATYELEVAVE